MSDLPSEKPYTTWRIPTHTHNNTPLYVPEPDIMYSPVGKVIINFNKVKIIILFENHVVIPLYWNIVEYFCGSHKAAVYNNFF